VLKKTLEMYPSSIMALKRLAKLLLNRKDYSNAYIYINKALKLNETESELWSLLAIYYMNNGDSAKYYECNVNELQIAKHHSNSFLSDLIPKTII
jgi:predicted Zn-dependent protease